MQQSQNVVVVLPNQESHFCRKICPQYRCGSITRKTPLGVSVQILIFPSHNITGAIDALLLRFECQQADHFVGALWICKKNSGVGTGAKIRLGTKVREIEPWDAESCSMLPRYVLKNGGVRVDC